jgi:phosphonate transport system substrate-binding protein
MKNVFKSLLLFACLLRSYAAETEISFGILGTDSAAALRQNWTPFLNDMGRETGLEVRRFFATDYAGLVEAMRFDKIQLAWLGNKAAIEAVDRANGEVFAQFIDMHGRSGYYSYIITHRESRIQTIDDMFRLGKELSFGLGDPQSTSGTLVPINGVFTARGLNPKKVFHVTRSSTHGGNLLAVINRQIDVSTNNSEELDKLQLSNPGKFADVRILWTSEPIPRDPLVWRRSLDITVRERIQKFVLNYGKDEREKAILAKLQQISGFRASDNRQLIPIRLLEVSQEKAKVTNDTDLSPADKKIRLDALEKRKADLENAAR